MSHPFMTAVVTGASRAAEYQLSGAGLRPIV